MMAQEFTTHWTERGREFREGSESEEQALAIHHALVAQPDVTAVRTVNVETGYILCRYVKRKRK